MAEAGEEWTTIAKTKGKKKTKPEDEWQEVGSAKKDRRRKESATTAPTSNQQQAPPQQGQGGQGGGRGRGRGDGGGGRGRGDRGGGRGGGGYQGGGGTLPRKDSRGGGRPSPGTPRGGGSLSHQGGGRGAHTPSPGPGARSNTPGSTASPPVRATPPPPSNPGPALQGAWAAKKTTPSSQEATPPPSENAWGGKKSSSQEPTPPVQSSQQTPPPPRKASWANVANVKEEEIKVAADACPGEVKVEEQTSEVKEVSPAKVEEVAAKVEEVTAKVEEITAKVEEVTPKEEEVTAKVEEVPAKVEEVTAKVEEVTDKVEEVTPTAAGQIEAKQEELTEVKSNLDDAASEPKRPDMAAISREEASDMLTEEDKTDMSLNKVVDEVKPSDNVTKEVEEEAKKELTVIKKPESIEPALEVTVADSNGNFPTDANENITETPHTSEKVNCVDAEEEKEEKEKAGDGEEINQNSVASNLHMAVARMDIAASDNGDGKPLTNGVDKEEPKGLPYTAEQWAPNNPEGKKQYERDFLLQLQKNPLSMKKPEAMPTNMEIIRDEVDQDILRHVASAPNMSDFTPNFITGRTSTRGTPNRRDSRQQPKSSAAARLAGVKIITLPREEVKLKEAENAWKPTVKADGKGTEENLDELQVLAKRVRAILNKLCPQKFDTLVTQFMELPIDNMEKMTKAMELVFEKALDEPAFAVAYARMCKTLSLRKITTVEEGREVNFRALLISRCQKEFQKDYMADLDRTAYVEKLSKATTEEEKKVINMQFSAQETKLRRRSLGNIKFIGELYRIQMLNGRIMHEIIQKLLRETDEESLECMCRLITTIGKLLDEETKKLLASPKPPVGYFSLDLYFTSVKKLIGEKVSTARIRFLMQDVLELRTANWVARREEAGPKTIEQIHKDAAMDAMKKSLEAADTGGPPPGRRSEDRSDRRRSQARPPGPPKEKPVSQDGWNNVPDRPARISQGKIDMNKLPRKVDASQMQFGPPGGMRPNWGRGSQQGQQKKTSVQVQPTANRFALFNDDDDGGVAAPLQPQYHGRASEPAISRTFGGQNSREGSNSRESSMGRRESREGSYAGRHSNTEATRPSREASVPETEVVSCLRGSCDTSTEVLETKTRSILEEFFGLADIAEAFLCITELYHPQTIQSFFENMFNAVVERSSGDRSAAGRLTSHMLEREALSVTVFMEGVSTILEVAEDLAIDIPKFWSYLAEILAPSLLSRNAPLTLLRDSSKSLPEHLVHRYIGQVLGAMVRTDPVQAEEAWKQSGLTFSEIQVSEVEQFCSEYGLLALMPPPQSPMASLKPLLNTAAESPDSPLAPVFDHITATFKDTKDKTFLRDLVAVVLEACLEGKENLVTLDQAKLTQMSGVLKPYLDAQKDREVQALYSLQALVHSLEHPNKLLHSIFDVLYEVELISEDAFIEWEESAEVGEQEGKGVALKSCTQFFQWLRTAEEDDPEAEAAADIPEAEAEADIPEAEAAADIPEEQQKEPVKFSIGEE